MPNQIIPITGFDTVGVVKDSPPVSLPPNAFSDVQNVRFKDGAVRKMEGEVNIFPFLLENYIDDTDTDNVGYLRYKKLKYCAWWPNPNIITENAGYYLIILEDTDMPGSTTIVDRAWIVSPNARSLSDTEFAKEVGTFQQDLNGGWQHTFFQGGFAIIINNGLEPPHYILDGDGNTDIREVPVLQPLPGWESYVVRDQEFEDTLDTDEQPIFDFNKIFDFENYNVIVQYIRTGFDTETVTLTADNFSETHFLTDSEDILVDPYFDVKDNGTFSFIEFANISIGDTVRITINYSNLATTCGVIRSFGDFLVAGNLRETYIDTNDNRTEVVRSLAGVVRTSNAAAPGSIPQGWDPFAIGVSTADEFVLTATGVVQDMVELQGQLFIYSNNSISSMRITGNPNVPLAVSRVTESYGAQTTNAVLEFDGRHFVVGSQDMYIFGGHPGSIQSTSDNRVRKYFYDKLNPLHIDRMFCIRYSQRDEIWICYPTTGSLQGECDEALIWNYRNNTWTIRTLESVMSGVVGPVPGGGLPSTLYGVEGTSGDNALISEGMVSRERFIQPERFEVDGPSSTLVRTKLDVRYTGGDFDALGTYPLFDYVFQDDFTTGPVAGTDNVEPTTQSMDFKWSGSNRIQLPRFLSVDEEWDSERGYYWGERAIFEGSVYRRIGDINDEYPPLFYKPEADTELYMQKDDTDFYVLDSEIINPAMDTANWYLIDSDDVDFFVEAGDTEGVSVAWDTDLNGTPINPTTHRTLAQVTVLLKQYLENQTDGFNDAYNIFYIPDSDTETSYDGHLPNELAFVPKVSAGDSGVVMLTAVFETNENGSVLPMLDSDNHGFLNDSESASPIVLLRSTQEIYRTDTDTEHWGYYSTDSEFIYLAVTGMHTTNSFNRALRDAMHNDILGFGRHWHFDYNGDHIIATSDEGGVWDIQFLEVRNADGFFTLEDFSSTPVQIGKYDTSTNYVPPIFEIITPYGDSEYGIQYVPGSSTGGDQLVQLNEMLNNLTMPGNITNWAFDRDRDTELITATADTDDIIPGPATEAGKVVAKHAYMNRPVDNRFTVRIHERGNSGTQFADFPDSDYMFMSQQIGVNGFDFTQATPTYIGILVNNSTKASGYEFGIFEAPLNSDGEIVATEWQRKLRIAFPRLAIQDRGDDGQFIIQPANYDDLANFVLETRINDSLENAWWLYSSYFNGMTWFDTDIDDKIVVDINPASDVPFINPYQAGDVYDTDAPEPTDLEELVLAGGPLKVHSVGAGEVSDTDRNVLTAANLEPGIVITLIFDVNRPWPSNEINANLQYPILASAKLLQDSEGTFHSVNKILGCDIGWARPLYTLEGRTQTVNFETYVVNVDSDRSDYPTPYASHVERAQLPVSPEFTTEEIASLALWLDGTTIPFFRADPLHNNVRVRMSPTNYPGEPAILVTDTDAKRTNEFVVTQDYKVDMRLHGRFMNYRITDDFESQLEDPTYNREVEWRLSGMQAEVKEGGKR